MGRITRAIGAEGTVRASFIESRDIAETARRIHDTTPVVTAALGRTLSITALMGAGLKSPTDSVTVYLKGDGPLAGMVCVADGAGMVKGYAYNPSVDIPLKPNGKLDVGGALGKGTLSVSMDLGLKDPYVGQVPLVTGEIAEDFTYYYAKSQQTPTAIALGVLVDRDWSVKQSGGLMVQLMPEADDADAERLEENIRKLAPVTEMLENGLGAEEIIQKALEGLNVQFLDGTEYEYRCDCSREKIDRALVSLGKKELEEIIETDGKAELTCQFCPKVYRLGKDELARLLQEAQ